MAISLNRINDEVFIVNTPIVRFGSEHISFLKKQASMNERKRARICAHLKNEDTLHEMLIVIYNDSYIRPHKHQNKIESFHIIEGCADVVVFDDEGKIIDGKTVDSVFHEYREILN